MTFDAFPYKIDSCVWEITLKCCFRCAYCGSCGGEAREGELSTSECLDVARQIADSGCRRVSMIGGEVFMRDDWCDIVGALTSRGVKVCVITNGYRMTPDITGALISLGVESLAVSIDGPREVHDAFRQKGSFDRAVKTLSDAALSGIPVSVISALRADNAPLIPEFYETVKTFPIFAWQIQACSPMGNAGKNGVDVRFDAGEIIRFVDRTAKTAPFAVGVADNIGYFTPEEGNVRGVRGAFFSGCSAGLTTFGIDSVGNVRGCESMYDERFIEGNLRERTLEEIWTDESSFAYNRKFDESMLSGTCAGCRYGSICAGGCRSYNYFTTGNIYENPLCASRSKTKTEKL